MFNVGDIVVYYTEDGAYTGVVMETVVGSFVTVQNQEHEQRDIPTFKVRHADKDDMIEELRCLYGFYH